MSGRSKMEYKKMLTSGGNSTHMRQMSEGNSTHMRQM